MRLSRSNALQLAVAGLGIAAMGAALLAVGLDDGHVGFAYCTAPPVCTVFTEPASTAKIVAGAVLLAAGAASAAAGFVLTRVLASSPAP